MVVKNAKNSKLFDLLKGAREQLNEVTSFIDASAVYGSTNETATELREFKKGKILLCFGEGVKTF